MNNYASSRSTLISFLRLVLVTIVLQKNIFVMAKHEQTTFIRVIAAIQRL